ncbi:hypothetical protein THASP1DRAFT_30283 [Thamnocephalis sphaerospora]|uniref:Uncharacterized protein n=1 Tax=Thamnocephalis sphaerospora TaxID=78915 RepID=A0A4P9XPH5_9FUNG|nr:hypothetical protein THASP1DRAFT_30283 [Thamnocephalis sphaerospora]|eukprot:RKP07905.1 hypothetical protein THASP1DRAFT_30283 [Thamnocephalis sphaerospora]
MAGVVLGFVSVSTVFPEGATCRTVIWTCAMGMAISSTCVNSVLLSKAYVAHNQSTALLCLGILFIISQPSFIYVVVFHTTSLNMPDSGCIVVYPDYYPWMRLALDLPANTVFSIAFLMVAVRQYRIFGSEMWARLSEDGMVYLIASAVSAIFTVCVGVFQWAGNYSEWFFVFDWYFTSFLLIRQQERLQNTLAQGNRPQTHIQNANLNDIATAVTIPGYNYGAVSAAHNPTDSAVSSRDSTV